MTSRIAPPNRRVGPRRPRAGVVEAADPAIDDAGFDLGEATPRPSTTDASAAPSAPSGARLETARAILGVALTVAIAVACVAGLVRYTRTSPRFAVRTLDVVGASRRSVDEIAREAGVAQGQNVFALDLATAEARLRADPWVERATLSRRLPGSVRIEVVEREAAALVALGDALYLATADGEVFKRLEAGDPFDLPVVTGVAAASLARDREGAAATVKRALLLAGDWGRSPASRHMRLEEVHVDDEGAMSLVVGHEALVLRLGKGPYRRVLEQAARVLAEISARHAQASLVFLDNEAHPERVVVRMR